VDTSIRVGDVVGKVDQELCEASFRSRVVTKDRRECSIAERLRKTLSKCLPGASIIAQSKDNINAHVPGYKVYDLTEGSNAQHASKALRSAAQPVG
jgi:hypothetical protein